MSTERPSLGAATGDGESGRATGFLGVLPRLTGRQIRLDRRLGRDRSILDADWLAGLNQLLGGGLAADRLEVHWRAAGLKRPGVVAHFAWPRLQTRVALGIDPPLAHALVDRLLGFERTVAESRLQVSPVEWGILSFLVATGLDHLDRREGPLGPWDLTIDRVGPDPFDVVALGSIITWRWRVRVGETIGSARLWMPESLLGPWLDAQVRPVQSASPSTISDQEPIGEGLFGHLISEWKAEVGTAELLVDPLVETLKPGRLVLIDGSPLAGTVVSPEGKVRLVQLGRETRSWYEARVEPGSSGARLVIESHLQTEPLARKSVMAAPEPLRPNPSPPDPTGSNSPAAEVLPPSRDLTVTLTVELGRVNLPLSRLAGLQPGDVLELGRHPAEPVELSSNGRLVARGELVQIDTELGVRITQVFL